MFYYSNFNNSYILNESNKISTKSSSSNNNINYIIYSLDQDSESNIEKHNLTEYYENFYNI